MNIKEEEALRQINMADTKIYEVQKKYEKYLALGSLQEKKQKFDKKNTIASEMALIIEYYIKGLVLYGMKIRIPDNETDIKNILLSAGITDMNFSSEEEHLIITGQSDKEIKSTFFPLSQRTDTLKKEDKEKIETQQRTLKSKYPILSALYINDIKQNNIKQGYLKKVTDNTQKINFSSISHDLQKAFEALLVNLDSSREESFIENDIANMLKNWSINCPISISNSFDLGNSLPDILVPNIENTALDFESSQESISMQPQPLPEIDFDKIIIMEKLLDLEDASDSDAVKNAFPKGRYGMISNADGFYYVADIDTLERIMTSLNHEIHHLWKGTVPIQLENANSYYHILPDTVPNSIVTRNSNGTPIEWINNASEENTELIINCNPGQIIDYIEEKNPKRILTSQNEILPIRNSGELTAEELSTLHSATKLNEFFSEGKIKEENEALKKEIENLKSKNEELTGNVISLQGMLGKSLGFIERVKKSRFGAFWFKKDLKELPEQNNNNNER